MGAEMIGGRQGSNDISGNITGKVVQAQWIETLNILSDTGPAPTPWEVPGEEPGFVDRALEVDRMLKLVDDSSSAPAARVLLLSGPPGVGKSELSRRFAAMSQARFPDGQLYVGLAAHRTVGGTVDLGEVYRVLLGSLGMEPKTIPATVEERAKAYRTRVNDRRMLVVVDDVELAVQVRALAPGRNGTVVVTSQRRLEELRGAGALALSIEPLDREAGMQLLAEYISREQVESEPDAAASLVDLCGGLPTALRAVGASLARRPKRGLGGTLAQLQSAAARARRFERDQVFVVFDDSFGSLSQFAARIYLLVGAMPGTGTTVPALAAALTLPIEEVEDGVDELIAASLLNELPGERYAAHSLIRLHAAHLAKSATAESERIDQTRRVLSWYLSAAQAADVAIAPTRLRLSRAADGPAPGQATPAAGLNPAEPDPGAAPPPSFADDAQALRWLEAEHHALLDCVRLAYDHGWDECAWLLCDPLWALFQNQKHYADWIVSFQLAIDAAERAGAGWVRARLLCLLARAHIELAEFDQAKQFLGTALRLARSEGDRFLEASVLEFTGIARLESGEPDVARQLFADALAIVRDCPQSPDTVRSTLILRYLTGRALNRAGRTDEAVEALDAVYADAAQTDPRLVGRIRVHLVEALLGCSDVDRARELAELSVREAGRRALPLEQATALDLLAGCADALGEAERAEFYRQQAGRLRQELDETGADGS